MTPVHEHDCDRCIYLASYPLRHPYIDDERGYRTGVPLKWVGMGDVYFHCGYGDISDNKYIVRYGIQGEYATTNTPSRYVKAPLIDGKDDTDDSYRWQRNDDGSVTLITPSGGEHTYDPVDLAPLSEDIFTEGYKP